MSIFTRIQKLEGLLASDSRLIVCSRPRDMSDEQLEQYLHAHGISTEANDLIVSLQRFGEGHPDPWISVDGARLSSI